MITVTLADRRAAQITVDRQDLAAVVASYPAATLVRLRDGRQLLVRESLVEMLWRWQGEQTAS